MIISNDLASQKEKGEEKEIDTTEDALQKIENELKQQNPELLETISTQAKEALLRTTLRATKLMHSGPLPPPEYLELYNQIIPSGADRIMTMAEKEQAHCHKMEEAALKRNHQQITLGQIFAFLIGTVTICISGYCILQGHGWPAAVLGAGGVASIISPFLKRRPKDSTQHSQDTSETMPKPSQSPKQESKKNKHRAKE